jgi:hypothetical protein
MAEPVLEVGPLNSRMGFGHEQRHMLTIDLALPWRDVSLRQPCSYISAFKRHEVAGFSACPRFS